MKKYIVALFCFIILSIVISFIFLFVTPDSLNISITMGIGLSLIFFASGLGKGEISGKNSLSKHDELNILAFLSIISIIALITVNVIFEKVLIRIILLCVVFPAMAFFSYWTSKHLLKEKQK
ncbi:MAG: hypothetical protein LBQ28_07520 [Prevotellaceae bacterium]|jgi:hypothetical protein|nr:hypothetical protein [Prevotellaceae bacterium]